MLALLLPGFSVLIMCPKRGCLHQAFSYTSKNDENMLNLESNGLLFYSFFFSYLITDHMMVRLSHRTVSTEYGCELEKDGEKRDILKCLM